jgi:hypothetical protein
MHGQNKNQQAGQTAEKPALYKNGRSSPGPFLSTVEFRDSCHQNLGRLLNEKVNEDRKNANPIHWMRV